MIKKEFTIACANDGSVSLNEAPYFNKMESGVTKLSFTLPELEGYAYLMCRHDLKEWYAIPITDGVIMIGQTVTSKHGRWAFNVCVTEKELINVEQADGVIYMSDVFEGLVYDNIVDKNPSAMEPNILKLGNDFKYLYDELKAKQDIIEDDLVRAEGAVENLEIAVGKARDFAQAAGVSASESEASAALSGSRADEAQYSAEASAASANESEKWARDSFISSEVCREQLAAINTKMEEAEGCVARADDAAERAEAAAEQSQHLAGANKISYDAAAHKISILNADLVLDDAVITDLISTESNVQELSNNVTELSNLVGSANAVLQGLI